MIVSKALLTSKTEDWATPDVLFAELDAEFSFTLDVCADKTNNKTPAFFDKETDGLSQPWTGVCFMNPPYGRTIGLWVKKAYESSLEGATVVCLVPSRTDTAWWHDYAMKGELRFIRRRLKFVGSDGVRREAPFPSAIVIFRPI
jgi:phage N-6-adenine-methyltransferase